jgi:hypothetical protein
MRYRLVITIIFTLIGYHVSAQHKNHMAHMPNWYTAHGDTLVAHVYFPDYYTFYDANREGFVYWAQNKWTFSPTVPLYLKNVDLSRSRIKILKGLSLDLHPESNYPNYMKLYPADPNSKAINVPVPNIQHNK